MNLRGRVNVPGLYLRNDSEIFPDPFGFGLPSPVGFFMAVRGAINARNPLSCPISELSVCTQTSAPRQDFSIPSDRSAQPDSKRRGLPLRVARSSFAPRRARIITYRFARRIIVPDPLLPARLAVLRTSWNHSHHAPRPRYSQVKRK